MTQKNIIADDEISLQDIYRFFKEGWKTIAATTALGGAIGVSAAFAIPQRFMANATIQTARVLGEEVESTAVLAEKMRSPTYYSQQTLSTCKVLEASDPADELTKELKPNVARNSAFVSVSFKSKDKQTAVGCLNAVMTDIRLNQLEMIERQITIVKSTLSIEKEKLKQAEEFVEILSKKILTFELKDVQFSTTQFTLSTLESKRSEIVTLRSSIKKTEMLLDEPQTKTASFATPIYSPANKFVSRLLIFAALAALICGLLSLMALLTRRVIQQLREKS